MSRGRRPQSAAPAASRAVSSQGRFMASSKSRGAVAGPRRARSSAGTCSGASGTSDGGACVSFTQRAAGSARHSGAAVVLMRETCCTLSFSARTAQAERLGAADGAVAVRRPALLCAPCGFSTQSGYHCGQLWQFAASCVLVWWLSKVVSKAIGVRWRINGLERDGAWLGWPSRFNSLISTETDQAVMGCLARSFCALFTLC